MKPPISRLLVGVALFLVSLAVLFLVVMRSPGSSASVEQPPLTITIKAKDLRFDVDTITAKVGQPVTIRLENDDDMDHAFSIEALNVQSEKIGSHKITSVTFTPQQAGTYQFRCPLPGHAQLGMIGTLSVVP